MRCYVQEGQLSVALLLSDLNEVKEISAVFRKLGIIPHFYEDLKTFWTGTLERIPSLCIVDVKKMSDGEFALHDHPAVKSEKLPIVFFYTKNTEPLLVSTNDFFHLGLLKKTEHYESSLKAILKRLNHFMILQIDNQKLNLEKIEMSETIEKLKDEKKANQDFLMMLTLDTSISSSGNCRQYALFHLNRNTEAIEWLNKILEEYPNEHNYYDAACLYSLMKMTKESISNLALSFENGYRDFIHLSKDDDLDYVRNNSDFISLVNDWKKKYELTKSKNPIEVKTEETQTYQTTLCL